MDTLSATELSSGWWEGEAIIGKSQEHSFWALKEMRKRTPFQWEDWTWIRLRSSLTIPCINIASRRGLSSPGHDRMERMTVAYIEQKNWTHVWKVLGYLRYDTAKELILISNLYHNELRLCRNFFQPVMKLTEKVRIGGRGKRKHDVLKAPHHRMMESNQISDKTKAEL